MKKINFPPVLVFAAALFPFVASAQINTVKDLFQLFVLLLANAMSVLYVAAFAGFFWGVVLFITNTNDENKRADGKKWMFWSIIALFVMITIWGVVKILVYTFNMTPLVIPQLPGK